MALLNLNSQHSPRRLSLKYCPWYATVHTKKQNISCGQSGFTLVELIMVIVLLSILSAVALPRFFARSGFDERVFFDDTLNAIRYAKGVAVATGCQTQFQSTTSGYQVFRDDSCTSGTFTTHVRHPTTGEIGLSGSQTGVTMTAITITFYPLGNASTDATISIGNKNIIVVADTGFVYAQ
ncbi:MAG: prepilin-type cleavage/methylation domain-containing protein [Gammaproteobacteria bacterium]|nr:MAG: prepilin-type cleavage/methylation domain-containing protein [Gammaproteobacteria bacterium]